MSEKRSCSRCGTTAEVDHAEQITDGWSPSFDSPRGITWQCGPCVRENLRAVEAKLDEEWW